jgi:hypothetical protein
MALPEKALILRHFATHSPPKHVLTPQTYPDTANAAISVTFAITRSRRTSG